MWTCVLAIGMVLSTAADQSARQRPDFSGTWMLEESNAGDAGEIGGAVISCGRECTIAQSPVALTVSRAAPTDGKNVPDGVLHLDGRSMKGGVTAAWDGTSLVLTRALTPVYRVTQTLTLTDGKLVMVVSVGENKVGPFRLIYTKRGS